ncbi:MAG: hypothetical protein V4657_07240 [Pseudomonadota bacterium]
MTHTQQEPRALAVPILQRHRDAAHNYFLNKNKPNALAQTFAASEARLIARLGRPDMVEVVARKTYEAAHIAGPFGDEPIEWGRGGFKTQIIQWRAVATAALAAFSDALKGE